MLYPLSLGNWSGLLQVDEEDEPEDDDEVDFEGDGVDEELEEDELEDDEPELSVDEDGVVLLAPESPDLLALSDVVVSFFSPFSPSFFPPVPSSPVPAFCGSFNLSE